jgi:hypothetical protein
LIAKYIELHTLHIKGSKLFGINCQFAKKTISDFVCPEMTDLHQALAMAKAGIWEIEK